MPATLNKAQFLKETCENLECVVSQDGSHYTLEGLWGNVVKAQDLLIAHLAKWNSIKQDKTINALEERLMIQETISGDPHFDDSVLQDDSCLPEASPTRVMLQVESCVNVSCLPEEHLAHSSSGQGSKSEHVDESEEDKQQEIYCSNLSKEVPTQSIAEVKSGIDLQNSVVADAEVENEVYLDIQLEHNYNHLKEAGNCETGVGNMEPTVENEIYMDIKLCKPDDEIFTNDLPVTLVVSKEDAPGIEVLQLNVSNQDCLIPPLKKSRIVELESENQEQLRLRRKKYEEHAPFRYFCSQCSFKTKRHSHMRKHARLHEKVCTIFSCNECDFSTIRASHLQRHIKVHKTEIFACSECTYSTHSEALLSKHQRLKHIAKKPEEPMNKDMYQCLNCNYTTTREKLMERHMVVHTKKEAKAAKKRQCFKCDKCPYQTPSRSNYYRHLGTVHNDQRPFLCTICGLCFKRSDTLLLHQATHGEQNSEATTFQCPQCQKFYRSANDLEQHQLTHTEEKRYLCEVCAASFKTRTVQRKHYLEKHVHEKTHACSICSKHFNSRYLVKRHMKVHDCPRPLLEPPMDQLTKNCKPQQVISDSGQWEDTLGTAPTSADDVQVLVLHQVPSQSLEPCQTISVGYEMPGSDVVHEVAGTAATSGTNISCSEGEIITLTFV